MFLDSQQLFSDAQALTGTGALSTNVIDLLADRAIGSGEPLTVVIQVDVDADQTTGDEDYSFVLEFASDSGITTARKEIGRRVFESGTPTAPAEDADLLVKGFRFHIPVPPTGLAESERYLGLRYVLAGTTPTITCTAWLAPRSMVDNIIQFVDALTIS